MGIPAQDSTDKFLLTIFCVSVCMYVFSVSPFHYITHYIILFNITVSLNYTYVFLFTFSI